MIGDIMSLFYLDVLVFGRKWYLYFGFGGYVSIVNYVYVFFNLLNCLRLLYCLGGK